jgi:hypothetical protein
MQEICCIGGTGRSLKTGIVCYVWGFMKIIIISSSLCNFSVQIWNYLQIDWSAVGDVQQTAVYARRQFSKPFFT